MVQTSVFVGIDGAATDADTSGGGATRGSGGGERYFGAWPSRTTASRKRVISRLRDQMMKKMFLATLNTPTTSEPIQNAPPAIAPIAMRGSCTNTMTIAGKMRANANVLRIAIEVDRVV